MNKKGRTKVYKETIDIVENGCYTSPSGNEICIDESENCMVLGTKFYDQKVHNDYEHMHRYDTDVKIVNNDCLYEAKKMIDYGLNPAVLNMASFHTPGGGVINGSSAQEENIFRRTNIFKSLYQFHDIGENYGIEQKEKRYPLDCNFGGIYTPKVTVFRGSDDVDYELLDEPFNVDIITLSALKNPKLIDGKIANWAKKIIINKIQQIFDIAIENKNDSLVLSAFGCGAYHTPPKQMAMLFADVLASETYQDLFKSVHFAIIDLNIINGKNNPNGNFNAFKETFG